MQRPIAIHAPVIWILFFFVLTPFKATYADARPPTRLDIIAIDYPPFISKSAPGFGTAFLQLQDWLDRTNLNIEPRLKLLPPARAHRTVNQGSWCASFYPPHDRAQRTFIPFSETAIEIKLVRRQDDGDFEWTANSYFKDRSIAVLRNYGRSPLFEGFARAGANLIPVETVDQGMEMLRLGRVDYAVIDSVKFSREFSNAPGGEKYQLSKNSLETTRVGIYVGPECLSVFQDVISLEQKGAAATPATTPNSNSTLID
ncbi:hypothetical protein [Labrenzia sp. PHM005]|uniref:hypothetical protein n=1 Tax=Labrenzia sp. PHM005 TaxID=2590016 RepID=UPI0011406B3D|nr:hypothetical protein [Labrenzia sp. PHM005]QDG77669.1 hypothetical protein FJ695_18360 [Labrenzia sp. PHM005]